MQDYAFKFSIESDRFISLDLMAVHFHSSDNNLRLINVSGIVTKIKGKF